MHSWEKMNFIKISQVFAPKEQNSKYVNTDSGYG